MRRIKSLKGALAGAALIATCGAGLASSLIYTPVNPNFGGSPLNGPWLQAQASSQNQFEQKNSAAFGANLSPGQLFANELTSQLYASLANEITQAIFGKNAEKSGTFSFGGTTITFVRVGDEIEITINDGTTITHITVPATP